MNNYEMYKRAAARLARCGIYDPTRQIIALEEEIENYRDKIKALEELRYKGQKPVEGMDSQLVAVLNLVADEYEKAKQQDWVYNPLAKALHNVWKIADKLETRL